MAGLELSRLYYEQTGKPMLCQQFTEYMPRIAVGLVGEGSECFGFDDDISRDHDFGPGFCIWLCKEDYDKIGAELQNAYDNLPKEFMGFSARNTTARGGERVGVFEISDFYRRFIGNEQPPQSLMRWLYLPEHKIATAVNGEVFEDNLGEFTAVRNALKKYYPEDIRIKKIAARAATMAQSGQYNYPRCMCRGDAVAASMALAEFIKATVSMIYLLNCRYPPYYKWQFHGLKYLQKSMDDFVLADVVDMVEQLVKTDDQSTAWGDNRHLFPASINTSDKKVVLIERICSSVLNELKKQRITYGSEDFLEAHTYRIMNCIDDVEIKNCHITEG